MSEVKLLEKEEQLVVFSLADEVYGVEISRVQEIIRMAAITKLPRAPEFVEGVINLRGRVIPVVELKKRFHLREGERTSASRIVVADLGGHTIGMIVDAVSEVLRVPAGVVEPPSPIVTTVDSEYIRGIAKLEGRLVILLDLEKVLSREEKGRLPEAA